MMKMPIINITTRNSACVMLFLAVIAVFLLGEPTVASGMHAARRDEEHDKHHGHRNDDHHEHRDDASLAGAAATNAAGVDWAHHHKDHMRNVEDMIHYRT